jgi:spore coat protein A, manganese oxidase
LLEQGSALNFIYSAKTEETMPPKQLLSPYLDRLPIPEIAVPDSIKKGVPRFVLTASALTQKFHKDLPRTKVWGYNKSSPGPTIVAHSNQQIEIEWSNGFRENSKHLFREVIKAMGSKMPAMAHNHAHEAIHLVAHLHGAHVPWKFDGYPEKVINDPDLPGKSYAGWVHPTDSRVYQYPNHQPGTTLWYHDHLMGITRLNVYAGLAGMYWLRDDNEASLNLPAGDYEIPLMLQDRSFDDKGQLVYPFAVPSNPADGGDPKISGEAPEFYGEYNVVNGKVLPFLEVEPRRYRFRIVNGANARFYGLSLDEGLIFQQIGSDGGFLPQPVSLNYLLLAPGERADVILDFTSVAIGTPIVLHNDPVSPFPGGDVLVEKDKTDIVMKFLVKKTLAGIDTSTPASALNLPFKNTTKIGSKIVALNDEAKINLVLNNKLKIRPITLDETAPNPLDTNFKKMFLQEHFWEDQFPEFVKKDALEVWEFINLTGDTHPMHIHLVQFQLLERVPFDLKGLRKGKNNYRETLGISDDVPAPYSKDLVDLLRGNSFSEFKSADLHSIGLGQLSLNNKGIGANEHGWKDTIQCPPNSITRVIMRFEDYTGLYMFHCHILEHEDHGMMRIIRVG